LGIENGLRSAVGDVGQAGLALGIATDETVHLAVGRVTARAPGDSLDRQDAVPTDARIRRAKEDSPRSALDVVGARPIHRDRSRGERHGTQSITKEVFLLEIRQQVEEIVTPRAARGKWRIADAREMPTHVMMLVGGDTKLPQV